MALFTPSESPAVVVKEVDLTSGVPNVQTSTGAFVGNFSYGPVDERQLVSDEAGLAETFGTPDSNNSIDFISASQFLRYSNTLQAVRIIDSNARNATANPGQSLLSGGPNTLAHGSGSTEGNGVVIRNKTVFESLRAGFDSDKQSFIAKYPGLAGNSLRVSVCPPDSASFNRWAYRSSFDAAPGLSDFAVSNNHVSKPTRNGNGGDEIHVAVIDKLGEFSGNKNSVLETFPNVSLALNAKNNDGTNNFFIDVINSKSEYVWAIGLDSDYNNPTQTPGTLDGRAPGTNLDSGMDFTPTVGGNNGVKNFDFGASEGIAFRGVATSSNVGGLASEINTAFTNLFADKDTVEVDFLIAPGMDTSTNQKTVVTNLVSIAGTTRKDCVVVTSPARDDVVNVTDAATATTNIVATADTLASSSYLIMDGNYLKIYDKFNDRFVQVPASSTTAGIMAATDRTAAPWFSPAGQRRGQYLGVTAIDYSPTKTQRDTLYKAGVNPITNIPGQGILLFGDKTKLARPSAFDRINVRRLFLVLERAISRAAENILFEFNDEFTRAEFVNIVEPVLREVKGRRGITDFKVVCDETNNTAAVIDRNEFIASIFIKPARSINFVTLNFVAVRTGVDFEEVVGTV